jgi:hypothetical protein
MKDLGFFLGLFAVILILAVGVGEKRATTSKEQESRQREETIAPTETRTRERAGSGAKETISSVPEEELTPEEVERKVAKIYRELAELRADLRVALLLEPASPYRDQVTLRRGNTNTEDAGAEYLTLEAKRANTAPLPISRWYVKSYVTEKSATFPRGDRILERWRSPVPENIALMPGETAYLITGDSPINISFRENLCTGYLAAEGTFVPNLKRQCPRPMDEFERFNTTIDLDDDDCYEFLERLGTCVTPEDETYTRSKVGGACSVFIENTFNYNDCVRLHRYDPFFDDPGSWRVYLGKRSDLWRSEREIIRLMDENDKVIAVIEY